MEEVSDITFILSLRDTKSQTKKMTPMKTSVTKCEHRD